MGAVHHLIFRGFINWDKGFHDEVRDDFEIGKHELCGSKKFSEHSPVDPPHVKEVWACHMIFNTESLARGKAKFGVEEPVELPWVEKESFFFFVGVTVGRFLVLSTNVLGPDKLQSTHLKA